LYQFSGGANGRLHEAALAAEGIAYRAVHVAAETRCCTTVLDRTGDAMTELIEPSHAPGDSEIAEMLRVFDAGLERAAGAAVAGSLPDGTDKELYTEVAKLAAKHKLPLLVDAVYAPMLDAAGEFILKINMDELKKLTGETEAQSALRSGMAKWPRGVLAITDGAAAAYLAAGGRMWRYAIPEIEVVSALGAGDTCSAVTMSEFLNGRPVAEAFACGLAAASANCLSPRAGEFDDAEVAKLMPTVEAL
jgi:fructose-1-phosphate kinase PfkB-like protein